MRKSPEVTIAGQPLKNGFLLFCFLFQWIDCQGRGGSGFAGLQTAM